MQSQTEAGITLIHINIVSERLNGKSFAERAQLSLVVR